MEIFNRKNKKKDQIVSKTGGQNPIDEDTSCLDCKIHSKKAGTQMDFLPAN